MVPGNPTDHFLSHYWPTKKRVHPMGHELMIFLLLSASLYFYFLFLSYLFDCFPLNPATRSFFLLFFFSSLSFTPLIQQVPFHSTKNSFAGPRSNILVSSVLLHRFLNEIATFSLKY
ncbi:hypothetical protein BKA57DRAFT_472418 [Linnemannia elongata]|nr:hypothetical protein BKA57DRAFT_472418 [Linnemannia elongata]